MSEKTAGQVAYEAYRASFNTDRPDLATWAYLSGMSRAAWEAAASAVASFLAETAKAARAAEIATRPAEGWSRIVPPERKSHYFVKGRSLCGKRGFPPEPLNPQDYPSPDDCAGCRRKLDARKARSAS